jgi:hypothetical protein
MGNQTLVPSQIQSVESYFLDLKSYIQFRASLGSTTFMKTAKVNLIENAAASSATYNDEYLVETRNMMPMMIENHHHNHHHNHQSNIIMPALNSNLNATLAMTANASQPNSSTLSSSSSAAAAAVASASLQQPQSMNSQQTSNNANIQRLNQQQMIRQRLQALRDSQQQVVVKIFPK